jgi:hypothetical protein
MVIALGSSVFASDCRSRFTADDFEFVARTLARDAGDAVSLVDLLSDPDSRDAVLDHEGLAARLADDGTCLKVSPNLYFYVLVRRALKRRGLEDRGVADYVASVLVAFSARRPMPGASGVVTDAPGHAYVSDLLARLSQAGTHEVFLIRVQTADYALFLSGVFSERIAAWRERRGAPGLSFYEQVGETNYRMASDHPAARRSQVADTLAHLASAFREVRAALNVMTDTTLHLSPEPPPELFAN